MDAENALAANRTRRRDARRPAGQRIAAVTGFQYMAMESETAFTVEDGYMPGTIGVITELHGTYYHDQWGFGLYFEAKVATELSEFLRRFDKTRDGMWVVTTKGRVEGSIVIDAIHAESAGAHLRWFILSNALRGKGIGRELIRRSIEFCRGKGYEKIYLWTFEGLHAARHLYEEVDFRLVKQQRGVQWGTEVSEQYFELRLRGGQDISRAPATR